LKTETTLFDEVQSKIEDAT